MDSVKDFIDQYIFTQGVESRVGQYGNDVVNLINKFIRIIIAFAIVYLLITKMPKSKDADHTMYFNLIIIISIFLLLMYIQKNWREYYLNEFLRSGGKGPSCAQDQDDPPDHDIDGNKCPVTLEENGDLLITSITSGLIKEFDPTENWMNYLYLIGLGLLLRQLEYKWYYAFIIFIPVNSIKGVIFYLLYASKYSPINFLFGKTGNIENPYIYDNIISESKVTSDERELKNFNERFYVMYIVLIILIFLTIIRRLTTNTIIDCQHFKDPFFIKYLDGCIGYRFYMILNVLLFIGFSTDFMDSLEKISSDIDTLVCPWKMESNGDPSPLITQLYTSREGECLSPEDIIDTPICNTSQEIIECKPDKPSPLPGCFIRRTDYNSRNYMLKDVAIYNDNNNIIDNIINNQNNRIIISKSPDGEGYIIDPIANNIDINDSTCRKSIEDWLKTQNDDSKFDTLPVSVINSLDNLSEQNRNLLRRAVGAVTDQTNELTKSISTNIIDPLTQSISSVASNNSNPNNSNPNNSNPNNSNPNN